MISLVIHGHTGKLGRRIIEQLNKHHHNVKYVGYIDRLYDFTILKLNHDVVILDVTSDEGCKNLLTKLIEKDLYYPIVIGSTGQLPTELINKYSKIVPVKQISNFSEGISRIVNILKSLVLSNSLIEISETHHTLKKDSPSGTAKTLANILDVKHELIESKREGNVHGIHTINISNDFEKITITHEAIDPNVFAIGCIKVIQNIIDKDPGIYLKADF
jgi:4-hydroxy-tetrahydrodipicolinate reductase